ncbi:hypothetical protein KUTeg_012008 [Tegillarca granosa]|uniref:Cation/H+ exchanger transmembrane domain-containing protein n=1 Tax=Tegillarca granosa TaxID=220873 RepID=A0ABQ9EYB8_TEGGR|nr:hypothetical protein KUTeg_012008 [Tegillarca granosa]
MPNLDVTFIQILVFSSLIVAVDPVAVLAVFNEVGVNKVLYFLVFGESLLNDGVTVVLYGVLQAYNRLDLAGIPITADQIVLGIVKFVVVCLGGLTIGILVGVLSSFVTKYTNNVKVVEPIAIFAMAYLAFLLSELFHLSGIIRVIITFVTSLLINRFDTYRVRMIKLDEMFIMGSTIKPLVNKLKVTLQAEQSLMMYQELNSHEKLSLWNDKYLRRWLLKESIRKDEGDLLSCYEKLVMKEHYKNLHLCGAAKLPEINQQL